MRVARIQVDGGAPVAAVERDGVLHPLAGDLPAVLADGGLAGAGAAVTGAKRLAPVVPGKVVAIGLNYLDHIRETGLEPPEQPLMFAKFPSSVIGAGRRRSASTAQLTERVDWEVELAVVIGRDGARRRGRGRARPRVRLHGRQRRLRARPAVRRRAVGARQEPGHVLPDRPGRS